MMEILISYIPDYKRFQRFDHDGNIATLLRGEHQRQIFSEYETAELDKISEKRLNVYDKHFIQYHDHQECSSIYF